VGNNSPKIPPYNIKSVNKTLIYTKLGVNLVVKENIMGC
jgi:hypothetical protein